MKRNYIIFLTIGGQPQVGLEGNQIGAMYPE